MNNILVVAFQGKAPTKKEIDAVVGMINGNIEVVKVIDKNSIADIVIKHVASEVKLCVEDEPLKNAATFINAHFSSPWHLLSAVAEARGVVTKTMNQDALLNAVNIIANKSEEECEQYGIVPAIRNACYNALHYILNI